MTKKSNLVYLTPAETAEILRVHVATVYRWVKAGKLPHFRLPSGDVRFEEQELQDWLAGRHFNATR